MWTWLAGLPLGWQVALPIIAMVLIVIIAIYGNAIIKWGKKSIGLGHGGHNCSRCRQLVMTKSLKYKTDRELVRQSVLRDQMNYAELKMHEAFLGLCRSYRELLLNFRQPEAEVNVILEQKEYLIYQEALGNSMILIKNELRRSFKENGFCEMSPIEYTHYCKEKTKALVTIGREYLMGRYPYDNMIIPIQYRFDQLDIDKMETMVFNIFDRAKEIQLDSQNKLDELDRKFDKEIEELGKND